MNSGQKRLNRLSGEGLKCLSPSPGDACPSISVMHSQPDRRATSAPHGISPPETRRILTAVHELAGHGHKLACVVLGDALLDLPERQAREMLRRFESRIALDLGRAGFPVLRLTVIESRPSFHANIVTFDYPKIERLRASTLFGDCLRGEDAIQQVDDVAGLVSYLAKERTSTATHTLGNRISARRTGSHRLESKKSGDRVRLSDELKDRLEGIIPPYKASYAKGLTKPLAQTVTSALAKPLVEAQPGPAIRVEETGQLALDFAPDNVIQLAETKGRARGLLQDDLARVLFISRPTFANARAGRYRLSSWALARVAEYARAA
jgi:hypothetical protein